MRVQSYLSFSECRRDESDLSTREDSSTRRGSGRSTHARKDSQHGRPLVAQVRAEESEGPIVPLKSGNADGGKGPWFGMRLNESRGRGLACA